MHYTETRGLWGLCVEGLNVSCTINGCLLVIVSSPAVTQMSTRWHLCSSCICVSCQSLWCPGLSTKTSWTAPTSWMPVVQRCITFISLKHVWSSTLYEYTLCLCAHLEKFCKELCMSFNLLLMCCVLSGHGFVGETDRPSPQNQLQPSQLCLPVSTKHQSIMGYSRKYGLCGLERWCPWAKLATLHTR